MDTSGTRVTLGLRSMNALRGIEGLLQQLEATQQKLSSQHRVSTPADDPAAAVQIMSFDEQLTLLGTHEASASDARSRLGAADTGLGSATSILQRAKELALQAGNATLSSSDRARIAPEVAALRDALTDVANRRFGDEYLFAGSRTNVAPYAGYASTLSYQGDRAALKRQIGPNASVTVNVNAGDTLDPARTAIAALYDHLVSGDLDGVRADLATLESAAVTMRDGRAQVGAGLARVNEAQTGLGATRAGIEDLRSRLDSVDMAEALTHFRQLQISLQAALQATSQTLGLSIFNFLR